VETDAHICVNNLSRVVTYTTVHWLGIKPVTLQSQLCYTTTQEQSRRVEKDTDTQTQYRKLQIY